VCWCLLRFINFFLKFINRDGHEIVGGENELDDASKPLSRAELHNRVIDGVRRKELEAAKEGYQFDLGTQKQKQKK
jgi:hypothetical protein